MIVVLSGEGPSDLGACNNAQGVCSKPEFVPGPMTILVDKEIASQFHFSMLEDTPDQYIYLGEERLRELVEEHKHNKRSMSLVGKKQDQETGYFYINAWILGIEALRLEQEKHDIAIAVLFRDCDGTHSSRKVLWEAKQKSMQNGFNRSELSKRGVPMIPKPKSESWLLCAVANGYQHCAALEDLPGNDDAKHSAKKQLHEALNRKSTSQDQVDWLDTNGFDHDRVAANMPSYQAFKNSMAAALAAAR